VQREAIAVRNEEMEVRFAAEHEGEDEMKSKRGAVVVAAAFSMRGAVSIVVVRSKVS